MKQNLAENNFENAKVKTFELSNGLRLNDVF